MTRIHLGSFEELVLLAVLRLGDEADGKNIRQTIETVEGHQISIGAIYTTLERLERKGFLSSWKGTPSAKRGGRAKKFYKVEGAGVAALNDANFIRQKMLEGLVLSINPVGGGA